MAGVPVQQHEPQFRCSANSTSLPSTDEAAEVSWHPLTAVSALADEAYAVRIYDALTPSGAWPSVRQHDGVTLFR